MNSNSVAIIACVISVGSFAAAGALWLTREHHVPPTILVQPSTVQVQTIPAPVVNNQTVVAKDPEKTASVSKPYVCTPSQAEAGECLPLLGDPVPLPRERPRGFLTTDDGRHVTGITVDMTRDKTKGQKKKKREMAKKKLQQDWNRAQSSFPFIFSGWK